jgi:c-di-GMP-binding flagellar brake protein YcgR
MAVGPNPYAEPPGDRRRDERRLFRGGALWAPMGSSPTQVRTVDLSASGIALVSTINPAIGCRCRVRFAIPTREGVSLTIDVMARVVRASFSGAEDGFRVGIEFDTLEPEAKRALKRFVGA